MTKSDFLLLAVIGVVPAQLNKYLFVESSYVLGLPIDYRAISIYLSDFAIIFYLLFFAIEFRSKFKTIVKSNPSFLLAALAFNSYLLASAIIFSPTPSSIYFVLKTSLFGLLALCAAKTFSPNKVRTLAARVLKVTIFLESLIIISQFILQGSTGLKILGERTFDSSTPAIAHIQIFGSQLLRAYGTFPHPNVAAAFLVFALLILWPSKIKLNTPRVLGSILVLSALLATFSKTALAVGLVGFTFFQKNLRLLIFSGLLFILAIISVNLFISSQLSTVAERLLLIQAALDISLKSPVFGVGPNNFILALSSLDLTSLGQTRLLQPVHNVFLLILAENGIIGLLLFTVLLFVVSQKINSPKKFILFLALLVYLSVDHFLWTLQQGQIIFWLTSAYILSEPKS